MLIPINETTLRNGVYLPYFERGLDYFERGRVLDAEWDSMDHELYGVVQGRGRQRYHVEVRFFQNRRGDWQFNGDCSCPVGSNCKHVVALILLALDYDEEKAAAVSNLEQWQQELAVALEDFQPPAESIEPSKSGIIYALKPPRKGEQHFQLDAYKARRLVKGGYGKSTPLTLVDLYNDFYGFPEWMSDLDQAITMRFRAQHSHWDRLTQLSGEDGAIILRHLINSGRCFCADLKGPLLQPGGKLAADFEWLDGDNGNKRLRIGVQSDNASAQWQLVTTIPPFYLDLNSGLCGEVEQPLNPVLFNKLLDLPELTPDEQPQIAHLLMSAASEALPLPVEIKRMELGGPVARHLVLHSVEREQSLLHWVRLEFHYGEVVLSVDEMAQQPYSLIERGSNIYRIERDLDAEQQSYRQLAEMSFSPVETERGVGLEMAIFAESRQQAALAWRDFLQRLPQLEAEGWVIEVDPSFQLSFNSVAQMQAAIKPQGSDWFDLGMSIKLGGRRVDLLPLISDWLEQGDFNRNQPILLQSGPNEWVEIAAELIRPIANTLIELFDYKSGPLRLPKQNAARLSELERLLGAERLQWRGGKKLRELGQKLADFDGIQTLQPPKGLQAELRPYQQRGLSWLNFLREYQFGGILADDMGLGKTVQTLALLQAEKEAKRIKQPSLIVVPTSLLGNWRHEAKHFTPELKLLVYHGLQRAEHLDNFADYDLIVTNYPLLARDASELKAASDYHYLILDEAQTIKNPKAQAAVAARALNVNHRLCLTGTPLENHLGELWALYDFLMPGFLGESRQFSKLFRTPIEKKGDGERQQQLTQRINPFLLRRTKQEVAPELPPKNEILRFVEMESDQRQLYETIRVAMEQKVRELLASKGLRRSRIELLDALLKLRQVCCDPQLVKLPSAKKVKHSAKLELLMEMLPELLEEGRRVLLFSQFTSMLGLIETRLKKAKIGYSKLTGQTRKRQGAIDAFQNGEVPIFLISIKAGGTGLNLTAADTVIHYDPWWNPAVENQATDRAYRIGQDKAVFVYKLICEQSVEEKVLELQQRKQRLVDGVYGAQGADESKEFTADELLDLFGSSV